METARCKAFLYAAETGSITKAAEELSYTPSGVSQLIQAFENEIGAQLLHYVLKKGVLEKCLHEVPKFNISCRKKQTLRSIHRYTPQIFCKKWQLQGLIG